MAYIKLSKSRSGARTVQLATKDGGRSVILHHFGSAHTEEELVRLKAAASRALHHPDGQGDLWDDRPLQPERARVLGHHPLLFQALIGNHYRLLGFTQLGSELLADLVLLRVFHPCSKLRSLRLLETHFGRSYHRDRAYRLLRKLAANDHASKKSLQVLLSQAHCRFYAEDLQFALYDVTTLYFESATDDEEYRLSGYSKDGKYPDPQIVVGLLTNTQGFPLAYETFAGGTFEGKTLLPALQSWRTQFPQSKLTVVADAAMLSKLNLKDLRDSHFDFIVGARLKSLSASLTTQVTAIAKADGAPQEFDLNGERLIVQYSEKRAQKDRKLIERAILKAQELVDGKRPLTRRPRFLSTDGSPTLSLNQAAIDEALALAGLKGYVTSLTSVTPLEIVSRYHQLWHIENSFRMSKHDLRARPIFHRKEDAIKAHLLIVVMALALSKLIELRTAQSIERTIDMLSGAMSYVVRDVHTGHQWVQHPDLEQLPIPAELRVQLDELQLSDFTGD